MWILWIYFDSVLRLAPGARSSCLICRILNGAERPSGPGKQSFDLLNMDIDENPSESTRSEITHLLDEFNRAKVGDYNHVPLSLSVSENEDLIAGLVGGTYWGYLYIDSLIVIQAHRKLGIGKRLLLRAEQIAIERKCKHACIDSHDFQGFQFYTKFGYEIIGKLPELPPGNFKYHLYKKLV